MAKTETITRFEISKKRFEELFKKIKSRKVLVIGDLMLDEYIFGDVERISPEAPVPVVKEVARKHVPGGAANLAANLLSLGSSVALIGVIGRDSAGQILRKTLGHLGGEKILLNFIQTERPTTVKTRVIARAQQIVRIDREANAPIDDSVLNKSTEWVKKQLKDADAILISDYNKGMIASELSRRVINIGKKHNKPIFVDPKGENFKKYKGANFVLPNFHEFKVGLGKRVEFLDLPSWTSRMRSNLKLEGLLVTLGEKGMFLTTANSDNFYIPAADVGEVVDVSGAGDTVMALFSLALISGASYEEALFLATAGASLVIQKLGTALTDPEELREIILGKGIKLKDEQEFN